MNQHLKLSKQLTWAPGGVPSFLEETSPTYVLRKDQVILRVWVPSVVLWEWFESLKKTLYYLRIAA